MISRFFGYFLTKFSMPYLLHLSRHYKVGFASVFWSRWIRHARFFFDLVAHFSELNPKDPMPVAGGSLMPPPPAPEHGRWSKNRHDHLAPTSAPPNVGMHRRGSLQLWQFLLALLNDPTNHSAIVWTGRGMEFKLIEPEEVKGLAGFI